MNLKLKQSPRNSLKDWTDRDPSSRTERAQFYRPNCADRTESQKATELTETKPGSKELFIRKGSTRLC